MSKMDSFPKSNNSAESKIISPKKITIAIGGVASILLGGAIKNHFDTPNINWTEAQIQNKIGETAKEKENKLPGSKEATKLQEKIGTLGDLRDTRRKVELDCNRPIKPIDSKLDQVCVDKKITELDKLKNKTSKQPNIVQSINESTPSQEQQPSETKGLRTKHTSQIVNGKRETIYISESHRKLIGKVVKLVDEGKIKFTNDFSDKENMGESPDFTGIRAGYVQPEALEVLITLAENFKEVGIGGTFKIGDMPGHSDGLSFDLVTVDGFFTINATNGDPKSLAKFVEVNKVLQKTGKVYQIVAAKKLAQTMQSMPGFQGPQLNKNGVNHFNASTKNIRIGTTPNENNRTARHEDHEHFDIKDNPSTPAVRSSTRSNSPDLFSQDDSKPAPKRNIRKPNGDEKIEKQASKK
jgi:hypothetical protein